MRGVVMTIVMFGVGVVSRVTMTGTIEIDVGVGIVCPREVRISRIPR